MVITMRVGFCWEDFVDLIGKNGMGKNSNDGHDAAPPPTTHHDQQEANLDETAMLGQSPTPPSPPQIGDVHHDWVGKSLGKYEVTQVLGKGGMGVVLGAHDKVIDRRVAIKVLAEHLASDETALARFLSEARAAGQLNHPNVASIYEVGEEGNVHFLVMEFVPGGSLADRLEQQGPLSLLDATRALIDACKGIAAAHASGLIHRDLKPANFMRAADGSVKITDFGLAKVTSVQSQQMTQAGTVLGTPFYMSPEQCRGEAVDGRSDLYSLGATYFSLLTGKNPYHDSTSIPQVMYSHCHGEIPDPREIDDAIPAACGRIIAKAMAKEPAGRYPSAKAMLVNVEMINATLSGQTLDLPSESGTHAPFVSDRAAPANTPPTSRRTGYSIAGGSLLLLAALAALMIIWRPWKGLPADQDRAALVPPATIEPIKIGILHSLSGTMANSEMVVVDATLFAVEEVNQSGGVLGRPLKAVVADGRSDPALFAREAKRLITEEQVSTIFGCWTSASRKMVKPIVEEHDHLLVYPLQYEGLETSPNIVYMGTAPTSRYYPLWSGLLRHSARDDFFSSAPIMFFPVRPTKSSRTN